MSRVWKHTYIRKYLVLFLVTYEESRSIQVKFLSLGFFFLSIAGIRNTCWNHIKLWLNLTCPVPSAQIPSVNYFLPLWTLLFLLSSSCGSLTEPLNAFWCQFHSRPGVNLQDQPLLPLGLSWTTLVSNLGPWLTTLDSCFGVHLSSRGCVYVDSQCN